MGINEQLRQQRDLARTKASMALNSGNRLSAAMFAGRAEAYDHALALVMAQDTTDANKHITQTNTEE